MAWGLLTTSGFAAGLAEKDLGVGVAGGRVPLDLVSTTGLLGAAGFAGAAGLTGAAAEAGAAGRAGGLCGLAITWGLATGWLGAAGLAGGLWGLAAAALAATGFCGVTGVFAFFTDRMALAPAGFAGAALPAPALWLSIERMRPASSSLMELLWLFAAMESFSAASKTSLFSRPRSLDSS